MAARGDRLAKRPGHHRIVPCSGRRLGPVAAVVCVRLDSGLALVAGRLEIRLFSHAANYRLVRPAVLDSRFFRPAARPRPRLARHRGVSLAPASSIY